MADVSGKTGGGGGAWVEIERPKPPRVGDHYRYWGDPPPELSERCRYWLRQIERGWRPNKTIARHCYDCSAEWYGIYIWEYTDVIYPALAGAWGLARAFDTIHRVRTGQHTTADGIAIARACGIVARHATHEPVDMAAAVAELHAVTADPHLLGHGWPHDDPPPGYPAFSDPWREAKRKILLAAGAQPQPPWWETA